MFFWYLDLLSLILPPHYSMRWWDDQVSVFYFLSLIFEGVVGFAWMGFGWCVDGHLIHALLKSEVRERERKEVSWFVSLEQERFIWPVAGWSDPSSAERGACVWVCGLRWVSLDDKSGSGLSSAVSPEWWEQFERLYCTLISLSLRLSQVEFCFCFKLGHSFKPTPASDSDLLPSESLSKLDYKSSFLRYSTHKLLSQNTHSLLSLHIIIFRFFRSSIAYLQHRTV